MTEHLPHVNAALNLASTTLLLAGWSLARRRKIRPHRACMLGALLCSALFLSSYVLRIALEGPQTYAGTGWDLHVYRAVLTSHALLAAIVPFLVIRTVYLGLKSRTAAHRRWAAVTLPIWLYVSATGIAVYVMLNAGQQ